MKPLISIIVPTYNCIGYMDETIASVTDGMPADCELILSDDGSTDGTQDALTGMRKAAPDPRVKILLNRHGGVSAARNAGLAAARGTFIGFLDSDDLLCPGFLERSRRLLASGADLYLFGFERTGPGDAPPALLEDRRYESASAFADHYIRDRHLLVYSACNKYYRKSLLDEHGIRFREGVSFGEDRLFNYDYLPHCGPVETSGLAMFRYMNRSPESASKRALTRSEAMALHEAKMHCFLTLSSGTSEAEREAFIRYDIATETARLAACDRIEAARSDT